MLKYLRRALAFEWELRGNIRKWGGAGTGQSWPSPTELVWNQTEMPFALCFIWPTLRFPVEALAMTFLKGPAKSLTVIRGRVVGVILALGMSPTESVFLNLRNGLKAQR